MARPKINKTGHWAFNVYLLHTGDPDAWPKDTFVHRSTARTEQEAFDEGIQIGKQKWGVNASVSTDKRAYYHEGPP